MTWHLLRVLKMNIRFHSTASMLACLYHGSTTVFLSSIPRRHRRCALDLVESRMHHILFLNHWCSMGRLWKQYPLSSLLHLSNIPRQLRSSVSQQLIVPKTKLNLGKRAFSVAAPRVWNELPIALKTSETIAIFRKKLKTYLFQIAFPP